METKYQNGDQLEIEQINPTMKKKKVSRGMHVFSVVMFMLRRSRRRKSFHTGFWRRVVESVRNVHSESTIMPSSNFINTIVLPPAPTPAADIGHEGGDDDDDDESRDRLSEVKEVFTAASSSSSGISGYGSAMSLRDLDYHHDDNDVEYYSDVEGGDDMIDEKAEEFILKFHAQMKMQNHVYSERCKAKRGNDDELVI
ncbi:unnamed protein product [Thlaspi arvense]|uniref:Cotton fiber protein n=1 Tax=Thlaspi arvense TaxID=13288 RepID=A0AAU9RHE1_THLAR|nr:unnamed protein product [Thlaspi arvense]